MQNVEGSVIAEWVRMDDRKTGVPGYLARPRNATRAPGIVLVHDRWGISQDNPDAVPQHAYDTVQTLAADGYVCVCVDLFSHGDTDHTVTDATAMRDLGAGLHYLEGRPDVDPNRIGVVGFCLGGRLALLMATHYPEVGAIVDYYGRPLNSQIGERQPEHPMDRLDRLRCPVLGLFGAEDRGIPAEQAYQLDAQLERLGIPHRVIVYPGAGHAFLNHKEEHAYNPEVARVAWEETRRFLADALKVKTTA